MVIVKTGAITRDSTSQFLMQVRQLHRKGKWLHQLSLIAFDEIRTFMVAHYNKNIIATAVPLIDGEY
jgi:hypothetical protein